MCRKETTKVEKLKLNMILILLVRSFIAGSDNDLEILMPLTRRNNRKWKFGSFTHLKLLVSIDDAQNI